MENRDPQPLTREGTLLLVVDVQEKLVPHIHEHEAMVTEVVKLIKFADALGIPVMSVEQEKLGATIAPVTEALGERKPFVKSTFGSFGCALFVDRLGEMRLKNLVLVGIESHVCVLQTAFGALRKGLRVQVVEDAVSSRLPANKANALARMRAAGVEITCAESLMFELLYRAGTEEFKKVLPLIK